MDKNEQKNTGAAEGEKVTRIKLNAPANISAISGLQPTEQPVTAYDFKAENPQDVYPVAEAFWQMTLSALADVPEDEALYVFLGESHNCPSHKITQAAILSMASAWRAAAAPDENRNFVYARERSFNDLADLGKNYKLDVPDSIKYTLPAEDQVGKIYGRAHTIPALGSAPLASAHVFGQISNKDIPLALTDGSILKTFMGHFLDPGDPIWPEASSLLDRKPSETSYRLHPSKRHGMAWRNASMVVRDQQAASNLGARIVFQQGGRSHLLGDQSQSNSKMYSDRSLPYEESWMRLHEKAGNKAIGLMFTKYAETPDSFLTPETLKAQENNVMIVRGLEYQSHSSEDPDREEAYIQRLRQAFSGPSKYFPEPVTLPDESAVKAEVEAAIKRAVSKVPPPPSSPS